MSKCSLRFEDELDGVASRSLTAGVWCDPVDGVFDDLAGVGYADGEAADAQDGQIDDVVSDEADLVEGGSGLFHDLADGVHLVGLAHVEVFEAQIAGAEGDRVRDALGYEAAGETGDTGERDAQAVMGAEAFGLNKARGVDAEASLILQGGYALGVGGLLRSSRFGEDPDAAVGEDSVYVEEEDFDVLCAGNGVGGGFKGHEVIVVARIR